MLCHPSQGEAWSTVCCSDLMFQNDLCPVQRYVREGRTGQESVGADQLEDSGFD